MATYETLITKSKELNAAGRKDDARRVAEIALKMRKGQPQDQSDPMAFVNKGIARTVGGAVDLLNPFDEPHALNPFDEGTGSAAQGLENVMEAGGIRVADRDPQNLIESFALGTGDAAGSLPSVALGLRMLSQAGGAVGQYADDALRSISSKLGVGAEMTAGGVSRVAEDAAERAGAPEWVQNTAAVAAPVAAAGTLAGLGRAAGYTASRTPMGALAGRVKAEMAPYTKSGATEVARERVQTLAGGPERADELGRGINPDDEFGLTPAQQTGDPNLLALEDLAARQSVDVRERVAEQGRRTQQVGREQVDALGGDVEDAQRFFARQRQDFKKRIEGQVNDALSQADTRLSELRSRQLEGDISDDVVRAVDNAFSTAKLEEADLWAEVDFSEMVPTTNAKATAQSIIEDTPFALRGIIPREARDILEADQVFGDLASVKEMHGAYSALRQKARELRAQPEPNRRQIALTDRLADSLLEDMGAFDGSTAAGAAINRARAYSAEMHEVFDQGAVGRITQQKRSGEAAVEPEAALRSTVGRGGPQGAKDAERLSRAGGDRADYGIEEFVKSRFGEKAFTARGEFTSAGARGFMRKNEELLRRYPELRTELLEAVGQRETAESLSARMSRRIADIENAKRSTTQRFLGEQPEKAIGALFNAQNPTRAARLTANAARKDKTGAATRGLKGAVAKYLISSASKNVQGESVFSGNALAAEIEKPEIKRVVNQILTENERARLRTIARALSRAENAQANASNVGESLSGAQANQMLSTIARIIAARQGAQLGGGSGGSIQTAQMASSRTRDMLNRLASDKASQLISDAITDPDLMKALLRGRGTAKAQDDFVPYLLPYVIGGAATVAADMEESR
ncbi:hypothetical protein ACSQ76_19080 [Roseovarius sp. B08]|uniref:hypothetical protein n=1 Tax=Roseovarius sp. B08 TaxID=3449223 RepID=UPI003EDB9F30